jgi:hypothetical protein
VASARTLGRTNNLWPQLQLQVLMILRIRRCVRVRRGIGSNAQRNCMHASLLASSRRSRISRSPERLFSRRRCDNTML